MRHPFRKFENFGLVADPKQRKHIAKSIFERLENGKTDIQITDKKYGILSGPD